MGFMEPTSLFSLKLFYAIQSLADEYHTRYDRTIINVSHWNPSTHFVAKLHNVAPPPHLIDPTSYLYSYMIDQIPSLISKLGLSDNVVGLVTENGSASITAVANWLSLRGIQEVTIAGPHYFSVPRNIERLGIRVRHITLMRPDGRFDLPLNFALSEGQALWLTNPIYNTGICWLERPMQTLFDIVRAGAVIVADEILSLNPSRAAKALSGHENFVAIYSPHKTICFNRLKFSILTFNPVHEETFKYWADVLSGGLGLSVLAAVEHFLSSAFDAYRRAFLQQIAAARGWHDTVLSRTGVEVVGDGLEQIGHFVTVRAKNVDSDLERDLSFLSRVMDKTGAMLIPGIYGSSEPNDGFSFRVNLAQDSPDFRSTIQQLYNYLIKQ